MMIVVEGISAAGKTTWCRKHARAATIPETGRRHDAPDASRDPEAAASFWVREAERRWQAACAVERSGGAAVCDTDPIKLHYQWSLWRIGAGAERTWEAERRATRDAIAAGRLGFADAYLVKTIDNATARRHRELDPARSRRNFDLHVQLLEPLMAWYRALEAVLPGAVTWRLPENGLADLGPRSGRADENAVQIFDRLIHQLPPAE